MHLVIFNKSHMACQAMVGGERINLMDEMFAVFVRRMCLSSEQELNRLPTIQHEVLYPVQVVKNQSCAFVPGKATRKTDGQSIRIEQSSHGNNLARLDSIF